MTYPSHTGMIIIATCLPQAGIPCLPTGRHPVSFVTAQVMTAEQQIINR
jgi:hypothetical protein